ncbi:ABC transporter permease [Castellaniella sp. UC4442_H9]|jgi:peptide/nickel transport system permease protein|nr:ABC transporter permease [Castellaniella sp.]
MLRLVIRRLAVSALVVVVVSMIAFSLVYLSGDPAVAMAGENASPSDIEAIRTDYGFDRPMYVQYGAWVDNVLHGNLGRSFFLRAPVSQIIAQHFPITATLGISALAFALLLSIPLGVLAALRPNTLIDRIALAIAVAGQAMPSFLFGLALIYVFGVKLGWLPFSGTASWRSYVLPAIALGYYATPVIMRLTRSGMLDALQSDHVRTARAYGLSTWRVVIKHALRHAIMPVLALSAVQLGFMLGGSIIIETVFSMKGLGYLAWTSIQRSDLQVIQAILLIIACLYALLTLLADLLNAYLDPRLRKQ